MDYCGLRRGRGSHHAACLPPILQAGRIVGRKTRALEIGRGQTRHGESGIDRKNR